MHSKFKIFLGRLQNGAVHKIEETATFKEIGIEEEKDLYFSRPMSFNGRAYLAEDSLIVKMDIKFFISRPCKICSNLAEKELEIKNLYIIQDIKKIALAYNFRDELKNACFLEMPSFVECLDNCPKRDRMKKYLPKKDNDNFPFSKIKE